MCVKEFSNETHGFGIHDVCGDPWFGSCLDRCPAVDAQKTLNEIVAQWEMEQEEAEAA